MNGSELRKIFIDYFKDRDHKVAPSAPLIPPDDPTLMFTSAGMVQFKRFYSGEIDPLPYRRAVSVQKCLRAGGKGSDLENVGRTLRHHTFFEMLGNFSFGDYFKTEAIQWAWEFIIHVMKLPEERLWVSTFYDDPDAARIWKEEIGLPDSRIIPLDEKENFWGPAGNTGACGPCSEILFFMGSDEELAEASNQDKETIARRVVEEGDTFLEIWNMVFPQFDRRPDGSDLPLKNRGIDTGAGLERMTTSVRFVETEGKIGSPYETDLLWNIVRSASEITGIEYIRRFDPLEGRDPEETSQNRLTLNAVADHVRAIVFALSEGMMPSNEGRGYVLRRIQRRALRLAHLRGIKDPFMFKLVDPVIESMSDAYPEIKKHPDHLKKVIRMEEESFLRTLDQGEAILSDLIERTRDRGEKVLPGEDVFDLHATYGFPPELTEEVAEDAGLTIDRGAYTEAMKRHKEKAKKSWKSSDLAMNEDLIDKIRKEYGDTKFIREDKNGLPVFQCDAKILAVVKKSDLIDTAREGDEVSIILDRTCFYAESGGQVGDTGKITTSDSEFLVRDTVKTPGGLHAHVGTVKSGVFKRESNVIAAIDRDRRLSIMRNHTATHLLQSALKKTVGEHVTQQGSWVGPDSFRFDFTNPEPLGAGQMEEIERIVQKEILGDLRLEVREMPLEEARSLGAIAPFGEKYGPTVRVVRIGDVSLEFCGGTHCPRTGWIGSLVIESESSIASGIRRIEGRTGMGAFDSNLEARKVVGRLSKQLSATPSELEERYEKMSVELKSAKKEIHELRTKQVAGGMTPSEARSGEMNGLGYMIQQTDGLNPNELRDISDRLVSKMQNGVVVIGNKSGEKANLVCKVTGDAKDCVHAGNLIRELAKIVGGGGGGRPDMAQAGGKRPDKIPDALDKAEKMLKEMLKK